MILRHSNSKLIALVSLLGLGVLGNVGCGSNDAITPSVPGEDTTTVAQSPNEETQVVGEAIGHFRNGHIVFEDVTDVSGGPDLGTQNFGKQFTQAKVSYLTTSDGVGTGSCTASQYCAQQRVTNNTGVPMNNVFIEVTDFFNVTPTAGSGPITLLNPVTVSTAYTSVFQNSPPQAASYGTIAAGASKTIE